MQFTLLRRLEKMIAKIVMRFPKLPMTQNVMAITIKTTKLVSCSHHQSASTVSHKLELLERILKICILCSSISENVEQRLV